MTFDDFLDSSTVLFELELLKIRCANSTFKVDLERLLEDFKPTDAKQILDVLSYEERNQQYLEAQSWAKENKMWDELCKIEGTQPIAPPEKYGNLLNALCFVGNSEINESEINESEINDRIYARLMPFLCEGLQDRDPEMQRNYSGPDFCSTIENIFACKNTNAQFVAQRKELFAIIMKDEDIKRRLTRNLGPNTLESFLAVLCCCYPEHFMFILQDEVFSTILQDSGISESVYQKILSLCMEKAVDAISPNYPALSRSLKYKIAQDLMSIPVRKAESPLSLTTLSLFACTNKHQSVPDADELAPPSV